MYISRPLQSQRRLNEENPPGDAIFLQNINDLTNKYETIPPAQQVGFESTKSLIFIWLIWLDIGRRLHFQLQVIDCIAEDMKNIAR
jgi:hypothetical protein